MKYTIKKLLEALTAIDELQSQLETVTAERDALRAQLDAIRAFIAKESKGGAA